MTNQTKKKKIILPLLLCLLLLGIIIAIAFFAFYNNLSKTKKDAGTIITTDINSQRADLIKQYLTPVKKDVVPDADCFAVTITPIGSDKSIVKIKNLTGYFFTGEIVVHDSATVLLDAMAPNYSENFESDANLTIEDTDYTCNGKFYTLDDQQLLPFSIKEEPLGNDRFKCYLATDDFDVKAQKAVAYYYYVLDTLYNFPATEYQLFDSSGKASYGSLSVDLVSRTVKYYQKKQLVFTESY